MANFKVDVVGKITNFDLPAKDAVMSILEAVINSIHSILERQSQDHSFKDGYINIIVNKNKDNLFDKDISSVTIEDNGVGFTTENIDSFLTIESRRKIKYGGKGVGRFSWLKCFSQVEIVSNYFENNAFYKREFIFDAKDNIDVIPQTSDISDYKTIVKLVNPHQEIQPFLNKSIESLAKIIAKHALYYLISNPIKIKVSENGNEVFVNELVSDNIHQIDSNIFSMKSYEFEIKHYKINKSFINNNEVLLTADSRLVESYNVEKLIPILSGWVDNSECYYVGIVSGDYLNSHVQSNRLGFNISEESGELDQYPCMRDIRDKIISEIMCVLRDDINNIQEETYDKIVNYIERQKPEYSVLKHYCDDKLRLIKPHLKEDKLDDELHRIYRGLERESRDKIRALIEEKEIFGSKYKDVFLEEFSKFDDCSKSNLAKYITYRKIIIELLESALKRNHDGYSREEVIHNILFPMRSTNEEYGPCSHNLWLIDDRLSYMSYIASDKKIIDCKNRPDILCMDTPSIFKSDTYSGMYDSLTIIELKRPMRNDYNDESNPMAQMLDYVSKIRNGQAVTHDGRPINADVNTRFYLYAICDINQSLLRILHRDDYKQLPDRLGYYKYHSGYNAQIEVLSFDKLVNDARIRNRIFIETLGGMVSFDEL